jgi:hypothetical protein
VNYEEFKVFVCEEGERRATQGGLIPIPELRARVSLEREAFDEHVPQLHAERLVHLLSHVDGDKLSEAVRQDCIVHSSGALLYWIRWL